MLDPLPRNQWSQKNADHLLTRAGFGGTPAQRKAFFELGLEGAVSTLLDVTDVPLPVAWANSEKLHELQAELRQARSEGTLEMVQQCQREVRQEEIRRLGNLRALWVERMIQTDKPLQEKLTLFWHGHFATSIVKVKQSLLMWRQNEVFRAHGIDTFGDLTKAISRDGAMIRWLDLNQSSASAPNENFARELLELFMLGEGHYTESDIKEAARAFTGYRLNRQAGSFSFSKVEHDTGIKKFMGKSGAFDGDDIIDVVLENRQCGRFVAGRLWEFFGGVSPTPAFQRLLGDTFSQNHYKVRPFLKRMFLSNVFYSANVVGRQIKSPVQWLVQTCRTLELKSLPPEIVSRWLDTLGQQLFAPPNVRGWEGGRSWMSATTLLARTDFASELVGAPKNSKLGKRRQRQIADPATWEDVNIANGVSEKSVALAQRFYGSNPGPHVVAIAEAVLQNHGTDVEGLRLATQDLLSMPEYQLT